MTRKIISLLVSLCILICLSACGKEETKLNISSALLPIEADKLQTEESSTTDTAIDAQITGAAVTEENANTSNTEETTPKPTETPRPTAAPSLTETNNNGEIYVRPTITASTTNISLDNSSQSVNITITGLDNWSTTCYIDNPNIVACQWGGWNGNTASLTFTPLATGNTSATVSIDGYSESVVINISAHKTTAADISSLTINGIGAEFHLRYPSGSYNTSKINSAEYTISPLSYNDNINVSIDVLVSMLEYTDNALSYVGIDYELLNERNVCIETGYIWVNISQLNQIYSYTIRFFDLPAGNYTLVFHDKNM